MTKKIKYLGLIIAGTIAGTVYLITSIMIIVFAMRMAIEAGIGTIITGIVLLSGIITIGLIIINLIESLGPFLKFASRY